MKRVINILLVQQFLIACLVNGADGYFYNPQQRYQDMKRQSQGRYVPEPKPVAKEPERQFQVEVQGENYPAGYYYQSELRERGLIEQRRPEQRQEFPIQGSYGDIISQIQSLLKSSYRNYNVNIHISNGEVTLRGVVATSQDRDEIEDRVRQIPGVRNVNNNLNIGALHTSPDGQ